MLEETFDESIRSRSTVSRILEDTRERYRRWCERRLDQRDVVYCFLDAIYLGLHPDDASRRRVCWSPEASRSRAEKCCSACAPGLWKAARELWPTADEQRCTVHALRHVTAKLPERHHRELEARWWELFDEAASPAERAKRSRPSSPTTGRPTPRRWR